MLSCEKNHFPEEKHRENFLSYPVHRGFSNSPGTKTSRGLCPKRDRKGCMYCLAGQNATSFPGSSLWSERGREGEDTGNEVGQNDHIQEIVK